MAIVFFEDFEHGATLRWSAYSVFGFATSGPGMFGRCATALSGSDFARYFRYDLGTARSQGMVSFAVSSDALPTGTTRIFSAMNGTTHQVGIYLNSNGSFSVSRDTTILYTSAVVMTGANLRYRVELGFSIDGSAGTVTLKVNGSTVISLTGQNTKNTVDNYDRIQFGTFPQTGSVYYDDILLDDDKTAFIGDFYGATIVPSSDVSGYSTPSTGVNRWATIDELPYSATDYNTFPATGEDIFGMSDLSSTPTTIYGVAVNWIARKDDTGTCDMRSKVYSGSANSTAANRTLNVASQFFQDLVLVNPNTSTAWTGATVNNMTLGIERTA